MNSFLKVASNAIFSFDRDEQGLRWSTPR